MSDDFDEVVEVYFRVWIDALDALAPFPFAAACLACVILDHVGNARVATHSGPSEHMEYYCRFIHKYLKDFPDDQELRERFYRALRSGLVHEARTDGYRSPDEAQVMISHEDFLPQRPVGNNPLIISVPWLCRSVKTAWDETRAMQDVATRSRIAERIKLYVREAPQRQVGAGKWSPLAPGSASGTGSTFATPAASGMGGGFASPSTWEEIERRAEEQVKRPDR